MIDSPRPARVLAIAGSDSSGAAGVQADLKTYAARGVYGLSALTAVTAQNSMGIQSLQPLSPELIGAQIDSVLSDIGADVVKTGMLLKGEVITLVAEKMQHYKVTNLIVDPVMVAGDGRRLLDSEADRAYIRDLFPQALIITPNLDEVALLTGRRIDAAGDMYIAAQILHDMGSRWVLVKGGHAATGDEIVDLLYDGREFYEFRAPRLPVWNARGTGCTFASTIAAEIAKGQDMPTAVHLAKEFVTAALSAAADWKMGNGRGTVWHNLS